MQQAALEGEALVFLVCTSTLNFMASYGDLASAPLLTEEDRFTLKGKVLHRSRGFLLFAEGEYTTETFLIVKGHVKVTSGGADHIIAIRGPGDTVGEMSAFDDLPRSASVYAMEEISFQIIPQDEWRDFVRTHWHVAEGLIRMLAARVREASAKQTQASSFGVEQRLAKGLLELGRKVGSTEGSDVIIRGISQRELAGLVGASRESVSNVMGAFRNEGLVSTGRQRLVLRDRGRLQEVADRAITIL